MVAILVLIAAVYITSRILGKDERAFGPLWEAIVGVFSGVYSILKGLLGLLLGVLTLVLVCLFSGAKFALAVLGVTYVWLLICARLAESFRSVPADELPPKPTSIWLNIAMLTGGFVVFVIVVYVFIFIAMSIIGTGTPGVGG